MGFSSALKGIGHVLAKPLGLSYRIGGTAGGFLLGGIPGAAAGYQLGDKLGNIGEDALAGRNVRKNLRGNLVGVAEGGAGLYGASKLPNNGGILNVGRSGPGGGGIPAFPGSGMPMPDLSALPGATAAIDQKINSPDFYGKLGSLAGIGLGSGVGGGGSRSIAQQAIGAVQQAMKSGQPAPGGGSWVDILKKLGPLVLGGAGAYQAAKTQGKADEYRAKAIKSAEDAYAEGAPLRTMGLAGLTDPRMKDVSSIFQKPTVNYRRLSG